MSTLRLVITLVSLFCSLIGGSKSSAKEVTVIWDRQGPEFVFQELSVSVDNFRASVIEKLVGELLPGLTRKRLVVIRIYPEPPEIGQVPLPYHWTYLGWRHEWERARVRRAAVAELTAVDGAAVLRVRYADGEITRKVIGQRDPLFFQVDAGSAEILYVGDLRTSILKFFLRSKSKLTPELAQSLAQHVYDAIAPASLGADVYVGKDIWFVGVSAFPYVYPFEPSSEPPTLETWRRHTVMIKCRYVQGELICSGRGEVHGLN